MRLFIVFSQCHCVSFVWRIYIDVEIIYSIHPTDARTHLVKTCSGTLLISNWKIEFGCNNIDAVMFLGVGVCIHESRRIHIYEYMSVYMGVHMYACMTVCGYVHTCEHVHECMLVCTLKCVGSCVCLCTWTLKDNLVCLFWDVSTFLFDTEPLTDSSSRVGWLAGEPRGFTCPGLLKAAAMSTLSPCPSL